MQALDYLVLIVTLVGIVLYGVIKGGRQHNLSGYLLANREIPWYMVGLGIMATQASAITFLSTTGQGYHDGMRFVQFYFGLPLAMVVLCVAFVPRFHRLGVYTAYEYLERRFDYRARAFTSALFLIQRGVSTGLSLYAPALVLEVMLGWDVYITSTLIGVLIIIYTVTGGAKAVGYTQLQQTVVIWLGMFAALGVALWLLPPEVSVLDGLRLAGRLGRLEAVTPEWSWTNRYTLWSGLIGGFFLQLSYFGTDQSQVQRYLVAPSVRESRMGLILNAMVKVPMQVLILFIGVMVFVFYLFTAPPVYFNPAVRARVMASTEAATFTTLEKKYTAAHETKKTYLLTLNAALQQGDTATALRAQAAVHTADAVQRQLRTEALDCIERVGSKKDRNDADYVFLTFVMGYLPQGLVGLVIAVVFAASMSSISAALSSLTSATICDFYQARVRPEASPAHYVFASRVSTLAWGVFSIAIAGYARYLGNLIEAVNILGSLFYGTILGLFLTAFFVPAVGRNGVFVAAVITQAVILALFAFDVPIAYLWYNVIGSLLVPLLGLLLKGIDGSSTPPADSSRAPTPTLT